MSVEVDDLRMLVKALGMAAAELAQTEVRVSDVTAEMDALLLADPAEAVFTFLGRNGVGKSALINALAGHEELLPTGTQTTTNCRVRVGFGTRPSARLHFRSAAEREIELSELATHVRVPDRERGHPEGEIDHVRVRVPSPLLERGVVLEDTTGAYGVVISHTEEAVRSSLGATGVVLVSDARRPPGDQELDLFRLFAQGLPGALVYIAITNVDGVTAEALKNARTSLLRRLSAKAGLVTAPAVFAVDNSFEGGRLHSPAGIERLRQELMQLTPRDRYLTAVLGRTGFQIQNLRGRVDDRRAWLSAPPGTARRTDDGSRTYRLETRRAQLKDEIAERVTSAAEGARLQLQEFRRGISAPGATARQKLIKLIGDGASNEELSAVAEDQVLAFASGITDELVNEIILNLSAINDPDLRGLLHDRMEGFSSPGRQQAPRVGVDMVGRISRALANHSRSIGIVFALRGALTPFVGPGAAWAAGGAVHLLIQRHFAAEDRRRREATAEQQVAPILNICLEQVQRNLEQMLSQVVANSRAVVDDLIQLEHQAHLEDDAEAAADDAAASDRRQAELAVLDEVSGRLDTLQEQWNLLARTT